MSNGGEVVYKSTVMLAVKRCYVVVGISNEGRREVFLISISCNGGDTWRAEQVKMLKGGGYGEKVERGVRR